jgi:hypothetical protein
MLVYMGRGGSVDGVEGKQPTAHGDKIEYLNFLD